MPIPRGELQPDGDKFRAAWGGADGWIAQLKVHAALHNHAGLCSPEFDPPKKNDETNTGWASGAWFIGPEGQTLAQTPASTERSDSRESILIHNVRLQSRLCGAALRSLNVSRASLLADWMLRATRVTTLMWFWSLEALLSVQCRYSFADTEAQVTRMIQNADRFQDFKS